MSLTTIIRLHMFEPHQFERDAPLKNQRENSMNTIKNVKIENITCNGNVAYLKTRTNRRYYCLLLKNSSGIYENCSQFRQRKFLSAECNMGNIFRVSHILQLI